MFLSLAGDPDLHPNTHHAIWFLKSLYLITVTTVFYSLINIFRPAIYRFRTYPLERITAESIVKEHGISNQDFFKYWPDKSFLFSDTKNTFLCYKVGKNHALTFGDPVGLENEFEPLIRSFIEMCRENDWGFGFHQVLPEYLDIYKKFWA